MSTYKFNFYSNYIFFLIGFGLNMINCNFFFDKTNILLKIWSDAPTITGRNKGATGNIELSFPQTWAIKKLYSLVDIQTYIWKILSQPDLTTNFELCQFLSGKLVEGWIKIGLTRHLPLTVDIKAIQGTLSTVSKSDKRCHRHRLRPKCVGNTWHFMLHT